MGADIRLTAAELTAAAAAATGRTSNGGSAGNPTGDDADVALGSTNDAAAAAATISAGVIPAMATGGADEALGAAVTAAVESRRGDVQCGGPAALSATDALPDRTTHAAPCVCTHTGHRAHVCWAAGARRL